MEPPVDVNLWFSRINAAQKLAEREKDVWDQLEAAVDGAFPPLVEPSETSGDSANAYLSNFNDNRFRSGDQLDVNLMGRALRFKIADSFDLHPALKFVHRPTMDVDVKQAMERLAEKLLEEGDAVKECRRGMELAYTRGQSIVWPMFIRSGVQEEEIVAAKTPPGAYVESVLRGNEAVVPLGADYDGIARLARESLNPVGPDGKESAAYYAMTEEQKIALELLAMRAERASKKKRAGPHSVALRAKIHFECTPYGTFCVTDSGVTDFSRVSWIARFIPMTISEFRASPEFTDESKRDVVASMPPTVDRGVPVPPDSGEALPRSVNGVQRTVDMVGRVVVAEVWDKINWRRIYLVLGHDKPVGKTTRYPYMDIHGRPIFPDFFPCVWRTPWSRQTETAQRVLGLPGLEPMWPLNIEYIKTISAFVTACKSTARIAVIGPGVDPASIEAWRRAKDGTAIQMSSSYSNTAHGDPAKQFTTLPMPPAPQDYLTAAGLVKAEAYESVSITAASMTGSPQASTASQESLIAQGASTTAGDVKGIFEDAYAELAKKSLMLFLEFASAEEVQAYLGAEALEPRPPNEMPKQDPATGKMIPAPPRPSIYEAMATTDLIGERLEARFASSTRAADFMRLKTLQDILATVNLVRDGAGIPYVDPRGILKDLLKEADVEAGQYKPTEGEIAIQVAAMVGNRGIGGGPGGGSEDSPAPGGDETGRLANGQRGPGGLKQSRGRSPGSGRPEVAEAGASGTGIRRATSPKQ